ncbi:MAG: BfmA/BtgA family mobilization protein [Candidatus Pacearchaeota archaeon]
MNTKESSKITTIKLERETKERLDYLKEYKRETYDEILQKMLDILNLCRFSPERARARLILVDKKKRRQNKLRIQKKQIILNQNQRAL